MHALAALIALWTGGAGAAPADAAADCRPETFRLADVASEAALGSIEVAEPERLQLVSAWRFEPPCAALVQASLGGQVRLSDGRVFERAEGRPYTLRTNGAGVFGDDPYDRRTPAVRLRPEVGGAGPIASVRVNSASAGGDFVGLWRVGQRWQVMSFSQRADRSFTVPRSLLTSSLPIRSLLYFPAPDTPTGRLELIQDQPNGEPRGLAFHWSHGAAFRED
jgi:hypothetical protein